VGRDAVRVEVSASGYTRHIQRGLNG